MSTVRVNARISPASNDWLDQKSRELGITKSGLISMAIENYRKEQSVINDLLPRMLEQLSQMSAEQRGHEI